MNAYLVAVVLGIVEGLTEFVPISSTGHLILAGHALGHSGPKADAFQIFIQLGAVLAVVWNYRAPLRESVAGLGSDSRARLFAAAVALAFVPAGLAGYFFHANIREYLFSPAFVAGSLVVGGVAMLVVEWWLHHNHKFRYDDARAIPLAVALAIGLAQVLALLPGVSRSAATILGGLVMGMSRKAATEFSFYLAIPTLGAATLYSLYGIASELTVADFGWYLVGLVVSFVTAAVVIRLFLAWVKSRDFRVFAWYRIVFGLVILTILGI